MVFWLLSLLTSFSAFASWFTRFFHVTLNSKVWCEVNFFTWVQTCLDAFLLCVPGGHSQNSQGVLHSWDQPLKTAFWQVANALRMGDSNVPFPIYIKKIVVSEPTFFHLWENYFFLLLHQPKLQSAPCHLGLVSWQTYFMKFLALNLTEW